MPPYRLSEPVVATFVLLPMLLAAGLVWFAVEARRRAGASPSAARWTGVLTGAATMMWMAATWAAAASGILRDWDRTPPPFAFLVLGVVVVSVALSFSTVGTRISQQIPIWVLVMSQSFRLPLELAMHALVDRGIMPVQMSYSGRNFDIVTGTTAVLVAGLVKAGYGGRWLVAGWNLLGLGLLVNIVTVAILSTPPVRYFGEDRLNVFVTYAPFVWLPAVMVVAALAGHLVIFRALRRL